MTVMAGFLYAKILTDAGTYFHLINTHCQSTFIWLKIRIVAEIYAARMRQIQQIRDFILTLKTDPNDTVIFCGDLNVNATPADPD